MKYQFEKNQWVLDCVISDDLPPLDRPGTRSSQLVRLFNAGLRELMAFGQGRLYDQLYRQFVGVLPLFRPNIEVFDQWSDVDFSDPTIVRVRDEEILRIGYIEERPYVYLENGKLTGLDHSLGEAVAQNISRYYCDDGQDIRIEWVALESSGGSQTDRLKAYVSALNNHHIDLVLGGQMMLPDWEIEAALNGQKLSWMAPSAILFTTVNYTGKDTHLIDVKQLKNLQSNDFHALCELCVRASLNENLNIGVFAVENPGPSQTGAQLLQNSIDGKGYVIHSDREALEEFTPSTIQANLDLAKRSRSTLHLDTIPKFRETMLERTQHFVVGDSLASGATAVEEGFLGHYLNMPANSELWPIAGFALSTPDKCSS